MLSASSDRTARVWRCHLDTTDKLAAHASSVRVSAFSNEFNMMATCDFNSAGATVVNVTRVDSGSPVCSRVLERTRVTAMDFISRRPVLVLGTARGGVFTMNLDNSVFSVVDAPADCRHSDAVLSVFAGAGDDDPSRLVYTLGKDRWLKTHSYMGDGRLSLTSLYELAFQPVHVGVSRNHRMLVVSSSNGRARCMKLRHDGNGIERESGVTLGNSVTAIACMFPREDEVSMVVLAGTRDGAVRMIDARSSETIASVEAHSSAVSAIAVPDSRRAIRFATASSDKSILTWETCDYAFTRRPPYSIKTELVLARGDRVHQLRDRIDALQRTPVPRDRIDAEVDYDHDDDDVLEWELRRIPANDNDDDDDDDEEHRQMDALFREAQARPFIRLDESHDCDNAPSAAESEDDDDDEDELLPDEPEKQLRLISEFFEARLSFCVICQDTTRKPSQMTCGHFFCSSCVRDLRSSAQPFVCPCCRSRSAVTRFPPRLFSIMKKIHKTMHNSK